MNCQEFESLVHALASGRLLNAAQQARARAHAESCSVCLTRFQNERLLATALRAIAAESREKQSPVRIENALLDAFRGAKRSCQPGSNACCSNPLPRRKPYKWVFRYSNRPCEWPGMAYRGGGFRSVAGWDRIRALARPVRRTGIFSDFKIKCPPEPAALHSFGSSLRRSTRSYPRVSSRSKDQEGWPRRKDSPFQRPGKCESQVGFNFGRRNRTTRNRYELSSRDGS